MTAGRITAWVAVVAVIAAALGAALLFVPRWLAQTAEAPAPAEAAPPPATRHIKATLFYVSDDGLRLVPLEREVPYGDGVLEQARRIVEAQLRAPDAPLTSAIPPGTTLRAVYLSERGEAFVDLSPEISTAHPGGALNELLTVYAVVDAVTTNLPAVTSVQILVDGHEVDTLAGHVDLRRPLAKSTLLIQAAANKTEN
jgi:spore germination protein GerM